MLTIKNKVNLNFSQEHAYQAHLEDAKIREMRILATLGVLLYTIFFIVDIWALSSALTDAYKVRAFVIISLIFSYRLTYSPFFIKYYSYFIPAPYLLAALGIEYMIYISNPSDTASNVYFAGLMLVIMILFSWSHLKISSLLITTAFIISMYVGIDLNKENFEVNAALPVLLPNFFFLVSAAVIGLVTQHIRDSYLRQNFLLQESLKSAYKEKSVEAKDNAYLANHDALTDLPNRRYMTELLNESLIAAKEKDKVLVVMFLDLNGFKQVNDIYGHAVGDEVLIIVARRLELAIRSGDHISRLGGDEYLLGLMMDKENLNEIEGMTAKFTDLISQPMNIEGLRIKIGVSVGIAAYPIHGNNIDVLLDIADKRMYHSKRGNENKSHFEEIAQQSNKKGKDQIAVFPSKPKYS
jgi:diguanylate cyclase (GGDEF)-like protein